MAENGRKTNPKVQTITIWRRFNKPKKARKFMV
jgi:hypothetical protein